MYLASPTDTTIFFRCPNYYETHNKENLKCLMHSRPMPSHIMMSQVGLISVNKIWDILPDFLCRQNNSKRWINQIKVLCNPDVKS